MTGSPVLKIGSPYYNNIRFYHLPQVTQWRLKRGEPSGESTDYRGASWAAGDQQKHFTLAQLLCM
jgi:hypothetical protein